MGAPGTRPGPYGTALDGLSAYVAARSRPPIKLDTAARWAAPWWAFARWLTGTRVARFDVLPPPPRGFSGEVQP